ncbi:MAG TPA: hypothetical protein VIT91_03475 [Chthoniobacterales bacterium]
MSLLHASLFSQLLAIVDRSKFARLVHLILAPFYADPCMTPTLLNTLILYVLNTYGDKLTK